MNSQRLPIQTVRDAVENLEMAAIEIDGSFGEGGGQVLRTSLSLAAITGRALVIRNIRAGRSKPGLAAQHLTAVRAAAAICNATLKGDSLGSTCLEFVPGDPVQAGGHHSFNVQTAGAVSLVLQTVLLPLAVAGSRDEKTVLRLKGGTHVPFSPSMSYIEEVYLSTVKAMGLQAEVKVSAWGWYPRGNGSVEVVVKGGSSISGIHLLDRGLLLEVRGMAVASQLPAQVAEKMAASAENLLRDAGIVSKMETLIPQHGSAGSGLFLTVVSERGTAGFEAIGKNGLGAEKVAGAACEELLQFHRDEAAVDEHLADQLLLPAALAVTESHYRAANLTLHLYTNAWVIEQFGLAKISVDETTKIVRVNPCRPQTQ